MTIERRIQAIGIALSLLIFTLSYFTPAQYHIEFLYSLIVMLTIWIPGNRNTFDASVAMTGLIFFGYFLKNTQQSLGEWPTLFLPVIFIWAFTYSIIKYKEAQDKLHRSTQHLNAMFKHATEGILISNTKGEIVMANPRAAQQFGYTEPELLALKIDNLVPRRFTAKHADHRSNYYKEGHSRSMGKGMNLYARRKDDSEFPVEISLSTFKIREKQYVISFIIDITIRKEQEDLVEQVNEQLEERVNERTQELANVNLSLELANSQLKKEMEKRAKIEEALRDSERLYSTISHNFPDGIILVLNRDLNIVFLDGRELHTLNLKQDDWTGKAFSEFPLWKNHNFKNEKFEKIFSWENFSLQLYHEESYYSISVVPLPDVKGFVKEVLLVIQNVSELKKAEREMIQALEKEKSLNEMKSRFVSIASHEFRTPLSTILSSVSLVERYSQPTDTEKRLKHIERIKNSVKNLTEILNDFLSLEKLEAGKIETHSSRFDLRNFAEELREELQTVAKAGQTIEYTHTGTEEEITLDKQLLRNICINLLNNAIKYSNEDGRIEFQTLLNHELTIHVRDYGIGIPKEDQVHLFERFFRAGNVTAIQGTGLGLNIVNRYLQLLNGKIEFESEVHKGTRFTIRIPLERSTT